MRKSALSQVGDFAHISFTFTTLAQTLASHQASAYDETFQGLAPFVPDISIMADFKEQCGRAAVTESYNFAGQFKVTHLGICSTRLR